MAVSSAESDLIVNILIFLMATFLGIELVRHVSRLLHTPLMSLTNAISSVSFVAALIVLAEPSTSNYVLYLVTIAVALAFTNIVSGFLLTERILRMFRKRRPVPKQTSANTNQGSSDATK